MEEDYLDNKLTASAPCASLASGLAMQVSFLPLRPSIMKLLHQFAIESARYQFLKRVNWGSALHTAE